MTKLLVWATALALSLVLWVGFISLCVKAATGLGWLP